MTDVLTVKQRSYNMSRIRSTDTGPEKTFRELLWKKDIKDFEAHPSGVTGRPDFYFRKKKIAVFVDGCFWHGCKTCFRIPATNTAFWRAKIRTNISRDRKVNRLLAEQGVSVLRVKEHDLKKNPEEVLKTVETKVSKDYSPKVLDLFAGAGGFSEGFVRAGCEVVGHIEVDRDACSTIVTRMIYHALVKKGGLKDYKKYVLGEIGRDDIISKYNLQNEKDSVICARIGKDTYKSLIQQIKKRLEGGRIDIIIGGPPCQAYSHIGRSSDKNRMRRDERNYLYRYYVEFLKALKPKIFVFENVPGLLSAGKGSHLRKMRRLMKDLGYNTDYRLLNAGDFGVPQDRKRIILIGWNEKSSMKAFPEFRRVARDYTVGDFLKDLPALKAGAGIRIQGHRATSPLLKKLGITNPRLPILTDHVARPQTKKDLEIYRLAVRKKSGGDNLRYNELPARLRTHRNQNGFLDRFKVVDSKGPACHTIIAHISKDGHYYIHPDRRQNRSLTVREAARLQTFPDDFRFEAGRTSQFRQIGNAVPPMLSKIIAEQILMYI